MNRVDRRTYESQAGTYRQPRFFFRKLLGRVIPLWPGFRFRRRMLTWMGVEVSPAVKFVGLDTYIDDVFPELISIGEGVVISMRCTILAHDDASHTVAPVHLGNQSFIGAGAIVLPGVTVGEGAVVAAGAVVSRDVPSGSTVGGVPARILNESATT